LLPRQGVGMEASQLSERGLNATVKCKEASRQSRAGVVRAM
jgi:hypothetical protein